MNHNQSRANLIWSHINDFIISSTISWPTFAATVREIHEQTVSEESRLIEWSSNKDAHTQMRNDAQQLRRFEHDVKFGLPVELEEPIVLALREHNYSNYKRLESDLASRFGLLAAPIPSDTPASDFANLVTQFGEAMEALSPIIADNKIDSKDKPHAHKAVDELTDVIAAATSILKQVNGIMLDKPTVKVVS